MEPEIECTDCGWQGDTTELLCTDEEADTKLLDECNFNRCPGCGRTDSIEDYEV